MTQLGDLDDECDEKASEHDFTAEAVRAMHAAYGAALRALFDKYKGEYAHDGEAAQLELIE